MALLPPARRKLISMRKHFNADVLKGVRVRTFPVVVASAACPGINAKIYGFQFNFIVSAKKIENSKAATVVVNGTRRARTREKKKSLVKHDVPRTSANQRSRPGWNKFSEGKVRRSPRCGKVQFSINRTKATAPPASGRGQVR